jgi:6,7-dimethyl-8-ribityllumazine synthase
MLTPIKTKKWNARAGAFAIVASRYNARYVDAMLVAAARELKRARAERIQVVRVPGAYEIPVVAARLLRGPRPGRRSSAWG